MPRKGIKSKVSDVTSTKTMGAKVEELDTEDFKGKSVSFDAIDISNKIFDFGRALTGVELYDYQREASIAIIYSVITFSGDVKTMLFSRQSGKTEAVAFTVDTLMVILPLLANMIPDLEQFKDGFRVGLFAPQVDQVVTTYSRARSRIESANAEMVLNDPDISTDVVHKSGLELRLSNGSCFVGQCAQKNSKIESKTYDLIICEEAQDLDDLIVSKSIEPMVSATAGSIVKVGTTGLSKNHFYYEIQHNKETDRKKPQPLEHSSFEYNYKRIIADRRKQYDIDGRRFHLNYENDIQRKIERWGEDSQAFRLAYALIWDLEGGMLITDEQFNKIINRKLGYQYPETNDYIVAGMDIGKSPAETVITIIKVIPSKEEYDKPYKQILGWVALGKMDYENQHHIIMDVLVDYNISTIYCDYTGVGRAVVDRLVFSCGEYVNIVPYTFTSQSKSDMWYSLINDLTTKKLIVPAHKTVRETSEFQKFEEQMKNCTKRFENSYLVCQKAEGYFDDFVDSLGLACLAANADVSSEAESYEVEVLDNPLYGTISSRDLLNRSSY